MDISGINSNVAKLNNYIENTSRLYNEALEVNRKDKCRY